MNRRLNVGWRASIAASVVLLSVSLAGAAASRQSDAAREATSIQGDITPFGIIPTETARACIAGLPIERGTGALRWTVRFIDANGEVVATEQLEVVHRGFKCVDLSYEDALTRIGATHALEPTGRLQLAIHAIPQISSRTAARASVEIPNVGTVEIVAASGQTTAVVGRFGIKTYSLD